MEGGGAHEADTLTSGTGLIETVTSPLKGDSYNMHALTLTASCILN